MDMETTTETTYDDLADEWGVDTEPVELWCENQHLSAEEAVGMDIDFFDSYLGKRSLMDYAEELIHDHVGDDWITFYIHYDRLCNDLRVEGYWEEGGHLFRP